MTSSDEEPMTVSDGIGEALGTAYLSLGDRLTDEQHNVLDRMRAFVDSEVLPVINDYWERAEFPWPPVGKLAELGAVGAGIDGYGCSNLNPVSSGLVQMELSRGDGSLATFLGVQAGLAMAAIHRCGSAEQRERWLPGLASCEKIGAFALTERDVLGGNGIPLEYHVIRHMADIESIHTFEGTETMQTLIVGRDITGVGAFP